MGYRYTHADIFQRVSGVGGPPDNVSVMPESPSLTQRREDCGFHWEPSGRREPSVSSGVCVQFLSLSLSVVLFCSCFFRQLFLTNFSLHVASLRIFAGVFLFLIYFARIDMIVGPPPPSTPRHKKYPTKGPMYSSKESPQYSPRLGFTEMPLSLDFSFALCQTPFMPVIWRHLSLGYLLAAC